MNKFKEAARTILEKSGKSMSSLQITRTALDEGLLTSKGRTPERSMNAQLNQDIKVKGQNSIFQKVGRSTFRLKK